MYNRIDGSSTHVTQADESSQPVDGDRFTKTVADLALLRNLLHWELPDKMGACFSMPHTSDASFDNSDSSSASTPSPGRPSTSLFEYRTAELLGANVDGICVGLTTEWLLNLHNTESRMTALMPGSDGHGTAAEWQKQYEQLRSSLRREGREPSKANSEARYTVFCEAGLEPSRKETVYTFDEPESFSRMLSKITVDGSKYLLSLRFAGAEGHTVATSSSNGSTMLFDPNHGEFTVKSDRVRGLFQSLANRYRKPNGLHLLTVTTQKM
ncbi:C58 family peptidase [Ensifer sp. IC3342]|nr:C58 family peptidase [Ensifer sp. BRP08]MCA1443808.1 C58 family peptidase [Ensifer sp. IC4062]MCA1449750.1 C58 family peptidase [Ensifer sp. IC3342]